MRLSDVENTMIDAMARAFFVCAWVDKQEGGGKTGTGGDWFDVAPRTPKYAREFALMFAGQLPSLCVVLYDAAWADVKRAQEAIGGPLPVPFYRFEHKGLEARVEALISSPIHGFSSYAAKLGHYLAMQGMGHGVSWFDNHAEFDIDIPHVEAVL